MTEWIFGIDGGGTSSRIQIEALDGTVLYTGTGAGTNLNASNEKVVEQELMTLLSGAFTAGISRTGCKAGYIGTAGVDSPSDKLKMVQLLKSAFNRATSAHSQSIQAPLFEAGNDAEPALAGALDDTEGFLLIAGTGSIAYGRTKAGKNYRAGGWGHFLGDEGSAFWIAFEAIKRSIRADEHRDMATGLMQAAMAHFGLNDKRDFINLTYWRFDKATIASFAPTVSNFAQNGDELAVSIMDNATKELAKLVSSVYEQLQHDVEKKRLALYGGLILKNIALRKNLCTQIVDKFPELKIVEPVGNAQAGACRLARELLQKH